MKNESGRSVHGVIILAMLGGLVTAGSIYFGNAELSRRIVVWGLVCLLCYVVYEYAILKLLYFQIHLRRTRVVCDSTDLRKQVWDDITLFERRVGMALFVVGLMFVGSIVKGFIGIASSLLLALAIVAYARKSRIL